MSAGVVFLSIYCSKSILALSYFRFYFLNFFIFKKKQKGRACAGAARLLMPVAQAKHRPPSGGPLLLQPQP